MFVALRGCRLASVACLVLLGSCGGGGGGEEGGGVPGGSGLVPTAAAPGATLLADAAPWRLLRPGAEWVYSGRESVGSAPARSYTARTLHSGIAGSVTETVDDGTGEPTVQTVSLEAGQVRVSEPGFEGLLPPGERFVWTELASPVRAGEQRTLLDRGQVDLGTDLDSDSRNDRIDIAAWTTVVGFEDLIVPALATPLRTLRVDIVAVSRLRLTRLGLQPVERLEISTWYAEGLGVVRQRERDLDSGLVRDHALQAWDGVTQALGGFGPALVPTGSTGGSLRERLSEVLAAVPVEGGNAALVMTASLDPAQPNRAQLARIDARGRLQALNSVPLEPFATAAPGLHLLPDGIGALIVDPMSVRLGSPSTLRVWRVDGQGRITGNVAGALWEFPGVSGNAMQVVSDGTRVWFVFGRVEASTGATELVVHVHAVGGGELAAPMVVATATGLQHTSAAASLTQGLVLTGYERFGPPHRQWVLRVAAPGAMPVRRVLAEQDLGPGGLAMGNPRTWPLVSDRRVGLLWRGEILARDFFGATDPRGLLLADDLQPLRSTTGSLDTEALPAQTLFPVDRPVAAAAGDRWMIVGHRRAGGAPGFAPAQSWLFSWAPTATALAPQLAALLPLALPMGGTGSGSPAFGMPSQVVPLSGGRVLVIGRNDAGDATVVMVAQP